MNNFIVYMHKSPSNKVYIGITCVEPSHRWRNGLGYINQPHFYHAIQKYGWNNFEHIILATDLTRDEAIAKEIELIAQYNSNNSMFGYNHTSGGDHFMFTEEARMKLSQALKGRSRSPEIRQKISLAEKGKYVSEESKRKMSIAQKNKTVSQATLNNLRAMAKNRIGTHRSAETRQKISVSLKGHASTTLKGKQHPNYGKHLSDEIKLKISNSLKNSITEEMRLRSSQRFSKKVRCVETGQIFNSISEAASYYNVSAYQIGQVCNHTRYKTAAHLHWEFT